MSTRVILSGHNFSECESSVRSFRQRHPDAVPVVLLDSAKTILLPVYMAEEGTGEYYLRLNGHEATADETVIKIVPIGGITAFMAVSASVLALIREEFGDDVVISSPLLHVASGRSKDVNIFLTGKNVYIAVWDKGVRTAEVFSDNSPESLLYYLQVIGRTHKLKRFHIRIDGAGAESALRTLEPYFRNVRQCSLCG